MNGNSSDNTSHINACCLNRFACQVNGKPRNLEAMPCGFEMCASVEACPKARRMQDDSVCIGDNDS